MVDGRTLTYAELGTESCAVAAGLQHAGMQPGDAVVFSVRPSIEAVILILAIVRCGGVVVAADPGMSPELFTARVAPLTPRWVMTESVLYALGRLPPVRAALEGRGVMLPNFDVPGARKVLVGPWPGVLTYRGLASRAQSPREAGIDGDAPAFIVFTSGTTSEPKAVVHTQRSLSASLDTISELLALEPGDRVYSDQLHMIVPALLAGATCFIPRSGFSAARTLRDVRRFEPTHAFWVPAQMQRLMSEPGSSFPLSLRTILLGSGPVPAGFLRRCQQALPPSTSVYAAYALTEMLPVCWADLREKIEFDGEGDLLGFPCAGIRLRIAADGEIFASGPNQCRGYLGFPPLREVATGDVGRIDRGRLVLLGRKKNMIIRDDRNIYPELIEGIVAALPGVRRCAMVGLYQADRIDELAVLVVDPEDGVDARHLESHVRDVLWRGAHRIDIDARPDAIVAAHVPVRGRSSKVDRDALRASLRGGLPC